MSAILSCDRFPRYYPLPYVRTHKGWEIFNDLAGDSDAQQKQPFSHKSFPNGFTDTAVFRIVVGPWADED